MSRIAPISGKASGLVWLAENTDLGYKVPEFDVIDASFYDEAMKQRQHVWAITDKTMCKCGTAPELLNGTKSGHNFTSLPGFKPIHWLGMMQGENHGWSQWEDGKMNWDGTSFRKESQRMDRHQGTL